MLLKNGVAMNLEELLRKSLRVHIENSDSGDTVIMNLRKSCFEGWTSRNH